jgi:hypothetical protein
MTIKRNGAVLLGTVALLAVAAAAVARRGAAAGQSAAADAAGAAMTTIRPEAIRGGMRFLADDLLEGRGTGTRGYELAARWMAAQFEAIGLEPAGDQGSYFQDVTYRAMRPDEDQTTLVLVRGGKEEKLEYRKDYITTGDPGRSESAVEAPVVFVGNGVTAPEQGYDDYKGVDTKGKIVAMMFEAPPFESSLKAHYSSFEVKAANAAAHGAVGIIALDDPVMEQLYSYKEQMRDLSFPQLRWLDKQRNPNDYYPQLQGGAFLNMESTRRFFEGSGHTADEVYAAINAGKPTSFAVPITARIHNQTKLTDVHSPNIVGKIEGSDARLKNEYVVFSSHLDHVGVGEPVNGDRIYNGALDNASGSAILVELARAFQTMNPKPKRSLLFLAVAGEEAGLLGSDYFAHDPTVAKTAIAANVNMDEDQMLWPLEDIIAFGAEHSTLNRVIEQAAARMHMSLSPDPMPEEVVFIRSDQYSFVKQGIPAVFPVPGFKSSNPSYHPLEIFKNWEATRYHQPSDDMNQPGLLWDQAAKYARFVFLCGYLIAEDPRRPAWNKGDFFGEHYGKK